MDSDIRGETIPARLKYWADLQPLKPAFIFVSRDGTRTVFTSRQLYQLTQQFGLRLCQLGVKPGDVVCNLLPDGPDCMVAFYGILCAGCVMQNGFLQMTDGRYLLKNLNKTKCRAVVLSSDPDDLTSKTISQYFDDVSGNNVKCDRLPNLKFVIYTVQDVQSGHKGFQWSLDSPNNSNTSLADMTHTVGPEDEALYCSSSGTTGTPKLMILNHRTCLMCATDVVEVLDCSNPDEVIFDPHPMTWIWSFPFHYMALGRTKVSLDDGGTIKDDNYYTYIRDIIRKEGCQKAKLSITDTFQLAKLNTRDCVSYPDWPLEIIFCSGQPMRKSILDVIGKVTNTVCNVYGSSELSNVSSKEIKKDTIFEDFNTGGIYKGVKIKIVDVNMKEVPRGSFGGLLVKTPSLFQGYFDDEELTRSCFTSDGWYRTKDYVRLTEQGELIVQGRSDDVIMRGENYYHPSWIETVIRQCPGVADVLVVKVPDETLMHEICACIIPAVPSDNIADNVKDFCLREFTNHDSSEKTARPKYYLKVDSFYTNRNGKIERKQMEKTAAKLLELE